MTSWKRTSTIVSTLVSVPLSPCTRIRSSHPDSPKYGQHYTQTEIVEMFKPKTSLSAKKIL
jgi:hypothetical protein